MGIHALLSIPELFSSWLRQFKLKMKKSMAMQASLRRGNTAN